MDEFRLPEKMIGKVNMMVGPSWLICFNCGQSHDIRMVMTHSICLRFARKHKACKKEGQSDNGKQVRTTRKAKG